MARKNLSEDQIKYTVNVEVEEAQKQIHKLNGTLSDLKKKEKELADQMKDGGTKEQKQQHHQPISQSLHDLRLM